MRSLTLSHEACTLDGCCGSPRSKSALRFVRLEMGSVQAYFCIHTYYAIYEINILSTRLLIGSLFRITNAKKSTRRLVQHYPEFHRIVDTRFEGNLAHGGLKKRRATATCI